MAGRGLADVGRRRGARVGPGDREQSDVHPALRHARAVQRRPGGRALCGRARDDELGRAPWRGGGHRVRAPRTGGRVPAVPDDPRHRPGRPHLVDPDRPGRLVLPLYEPIRLAEELVVLDIISGGRVSYVCAVGYREDEYAMFDVDFRRRGRIADEWLSVLLAAKTGEPFEHDGRTVRVTPRPLTTGGRPCRGAAAAWPRPVGPVAMGSGSSPSRRRGPPGRLRGRLAPGRPRARLVLSPPEGPAHQPVRRRRPGPGVGRARSPPAARRPQLRGHERRGHHHDRLLLRRVGRRAPG